MSINQPYHTWVSRIWAKMRPTERSSACGTRLQLPHGSFNANPVHVKCGGTRNISNATLPSVKRRLSRFLDIQRCGVARMVCSVAQALLLSAVRSGR